MVKECTVKAPINAREFIRIITFHREGGWHLLGLECSQSIFEQSNILFVLSLQYHEHLATLGTFVPGSEL